jgi:dolichol-phosphate mannosyltransferase
MRLAVVLPMYEEADNVFPLLARLSEVRAAAGLDLIAIAVDDGSRDATRARLQQAATQYPFLRWVAHSRNRGLATTLRTGIATALTERQPPVEAIACMDADLTHAPEDLPRLLEPLLDGRADFVLGSRYVPGGGMRDVPRARRAISVVGNRVGRQLLGISAADLTSGYRVARAAVYRAIRLEEDGFGIQLEGTVKAHRAGFRVAEVPITLGVRRKGYSKMAYTRAFWLGYLRLFVRLVLGRQAARVSSGVPSAGRGG